MVTGFLGPNGVGKTTMRLIPGAGLPHRGELAVFGGYTVVLLILGAVLLRRRDA